MNNVEIEIGSNDILLIKIDLSKEKYLTNSGRSVMIGTTGGNLLLWRDGKPDPRQIRINASIFRPLTIEERKEVEEERKKRSIFR